MLERKARLALSLYKPSLCPALVSGRLSINPIASFLHYRPKVSVAPNMEKGVKPTFCPLPDLDAGAYVRSVKKEKDYELRCSF